MTRKDLETLLRRVVREELAMLDLRALPIELQPGWDQLPERFRSKLKDGNGCWLWTACASTKGYGKYSLKGKSIYAHRFAYEAVVGPITEGLQIDHLCRVRSCVNPAHMELVTLQENVRRGERHP